MTNMQPEVKELLEYEMYQMCHNGYDHSYDLSYGDMNYHMKNILRTANLSDVKWITDDILYHRPDLLKNDGDDTRRNEIVSEHMKYENFDLCRNKINAESELRDIKRSLENNPLTKLYDAKYNSEVTFLETFDGFADEIKKKDDAQAKLDKISNEYNKVFEETKEKIFKVENPNPFDAERKVIEKMREYYPELRNAVESKYKIIEEEKNNLVSQKRNGIVKNIENILSSKKLNTFKRDLGELMMAYKLDIKIDIETSSNFDLEKTVSRIDPEFKLAAADVIVELRKEDCKIKDAKDKADILVSLATEKAYEDDIHYNKEDFLDTYKKDSTANDIASTSKIFKDIVTERLQDWSKSHGGDNSIVSKHEALCRFESSAKDREDYLDKCEAKNINFELNPERDIDNDNVDRQDDIYIDPDTFFDDDDYFNKDDYDNDDYVDYDAIEEL